MAVAHSDTSSLAAEFRRDSLRSLVSLNEPSLRRVAFLYLYSFGTALLLGTVTALFARALVVFGGHKLIASTLQVRLHHLHSAMMTYLCLIPGIPAALGGFLLPNASVQQDCHSKRLAWSSLVVYWTGGAVIVVSVLLGGVNLGISCFSPSTSAYPWASIGAAIGVFLLGLACALNGLGTLASVHRLRTVGLDRRETPTLVFMLCIYGVVHIIALPIQGLAVAMMLLERLGIHSFFDPARGGDPTLLRQISWCYVQPVLLVAVLPAIGLITHVLDHYATPNHSRHSRTTYGALAFAILGFFTWGIHLVNAGQSPLMSALFSATSLLLLIPLSLPFPVWIATLRRVQMRHLVAVLFAVCALAMLAVGLLTGLPLSMLSTNSALHGTYFAVGQLHFAASAICIMTVLAGLHYVWPLIAVDSFSNPLALITCALIFLGLSLTFAVQLCWGICGAPSHPIGGVALGQWAPLGDFGMFASGAGLLMMAIYFIRALNKTRHAAQAEGGTLPPKSLESATANSGTSPPLDFREQDSTVGDT